MNVRNKFWLWGYTQEKTGVPVPFSGTLKSYCSLEDAANYLGFPNTVFMNPMHGWERLEENLALLKDNREIICALPHGKEAAVDGARKISELSVRYPQIKGVVLDDFLQLSGHPTTPEAIHELKSQLTSTNEKLELYVVIYSDGNHLPLEPYLEYIDGIMLWRWVSTEHFWRSELPPLLHRLKVNTGKKIFHGIYLQNFAESGGSANPMEMELWKLQWQCILKHLRSPLQFLDGCILLQNGFFSDYRFRDQLIWLKDTLDWYIGTTSIRED